MLPRVLLVEDSRTQALRFQLELANYGLTVEIASDGRAGLTAVVDVDPQSL